MGDFDALIDDTFMGRPVYLSWERALAHALSLRPMVKAETPGGTFISWFKPRVRGVRLFGSWWYLVLPPGPPERADWIPRAWPDPVPRYALTSA